MRFKDISVTLKVKGRFDHQHIKTEPEVISHFLLCIAKTEKTHVNWDKCFVNG